MAKDYVAKAYEADLRRGDAKRAAARAMLAALKGVVRVADRATVEFDAARAAIAAAEAAGIKEEACK